MNAGRNVGVVGFAIGLSAAITVGMMISPESLHASGSQDEKTQARVQPVVYKSLNHDLSPRLDSMEPIEPLALDPSRISVDGLLRSRVKMTPQAPQVWQDPAVQLEHGFSPMPSPVVSFDGVTSASGVVPPVTRAAVGPNDYMQSVDGAFAIYDKAGAKTYPQGLGFASGSTLWQGFGGECETSNGGDLITLYDRQAGRWLMSRSAVSGAFTQCFAISQTERPDGSVVPLRLRAARQQDEPGPAHRHLAGRVLHDGRPVRREVDLGPGPASSRSSGTGCWPGSRLGRFTSTSPRWIRTLVASCPATWKAPRCRLPVLPTTSCSSTTTRGATKRTSSRSSSFTWTGPRRPAQPSPGRRSST